MPWDVMVHARKEKDRGRREKDRDGRDGRMDRDRDRDRGDRGDRGDRDRDDRKRRCPETMKHGMRISKYVKSQNMSKYVKIYQIFNQSIRINRSESTRVVFGKRVWGVWSLHVNSVDWPMAYGLAWLYPLYRASLRLGRSPDRSDRSSPPWCLP